MTTTEPQIDQKVTFALSPEIDAWREKLELMHLAKLNKAKKIAAGNLYKAIESQTEPISTSVAKKGVGMEDIRQIIIPDATNESLVIKVVNVDLGRDEFPDHEFSIGVVSASSGDDEGKLQSVQEIDSKERLSPDYSLRDMQTFIDEVLLMKELERQVVLMGETGEQAQASGITE